MAYNFSKNKPNINELNRIAAREKEAAQTPKPKKMKKGIVLLGLIAAFFGVKAIVGSLQQPSEGKVMLTPETTIEGTTVETEEEAAASETEYIVGDLDLSGVVGDAPGEEGYEAPEEAKPDFIPAKFKKLKDLRKQGGKKVKVSIIWIRQYDAKPNAYRIGDDVYFESKDGSFYVFHNGIVTKL